MTIQQRIARRLKGHPSIVAGSSASGLQQILLMCQSSSTTAVEEDIVVNRADEILRIWKTRLKIAAAAQHQSREIHELVEALGDLAPDRPVEQMILHDGAKLGTIFFDEKTHEPIGAVVKIRTRQDATLSHANYEWAMGRAGNSPIRKTPKLTEKPSRPVRVLAR